MVTSEIVRATIRSQVDHTTTWTFDSPFVIVTFIARGACEDRERIRLFVWYLEVSYANELGAEVVERSPIEEIHCEENGHGVRLRVRFLLPALANAPDSDSEPESGSEQADNSEPEVGSEQADNSERESGSEQADNPDSNSSNDSTE